MCETHGMKGAMTLPGFDTRLDAFLQWQASPWGRLRYPVTEADPMRTAIRGLDPRRALTELDSELSYVDLFDIELPACTAAETMGHLTELGFGLIMRYGVRCVCDYIVDDERKHDPEFFAELERLELALADPMPYLLTARFFQLVARR